MTSSLVGQTQRACGTCWEGSTRLSMARTKQVVFPLPLCACTDDGKTVATGCLLSVATVPSLCHSAALNSCGRNYGTGPGLQQPWSLQQPKHFGSSCDMDKGGRQQDRRTEPEKGHSRMTLTCATSPLWGGLSTIGSVTA